MAMFAVAGFTLSSSQVSGNLKINQTTFIGPFA
jgi:hypothetical protein